MAKFDFNNTNALEWLDTNPKTADLINVARSLLAIESLIRNLVPKSLAKHINVGQLNGQNLIILVPGPAHAARLNQITSTLSQQLNMHGWNINKIIVRINANKPVFETKRPQKNGNYLNAKALDEFAKLEQNIAPGPLADAIKRLLIHHS